MTPAYVPDPTRFYNHQDDLVAFMMMVIVAMAIYIILKDYFARQKDKEINDTLKDVAEAVNKLIGASQNDKK